MTLDGLRDALQLKNLLKKMDLKMGLMRLI